MRAQALEDAALHLLVLDRRFYDEVTSPEILKIGSDPDALQSPLALGLGYLSRLHLPRQIAVDGGKACLDALARKIVEADIIAREGAYMGDAISHLPGANHAD